MHWIYKVSMRVWRVEKTNGKRTNAHEEEGILFE